MARTTARLAHSPTVAVFLAGLALAAPRCSASAQALRRSIRAGTRGSAAGPPLRNVPAGTPPRTVCVTSRPRGRQRWRSRRSGRTASCRGSGSRQMASGAPPSAKGVPRVGNGAVVGFDSHRIYLRSEHQCTGGAKRSSHALMAISPQGDWLDVVSVTIGDTTGTRVLAAITPRAVWMRCRPGRRPASKAGITGDRDGCTDGGVRGAADAGRYHRRLETAECQCRRGVAERRASGLHDRQEDADSAGRCGRARDRAVVDLLVALAYPDAFSVPPSPTSVGSLASSEGGGGGGGFSDFGGVDTFGCANDFSVFGWDRCTPFSYAPFGILAAGVLLDVRVWSVWWIRRLVHG